MRGGARSGNRVTKMYVPKKQKGPHAGESMKQKDKHNEIARWGVPAIIIAGCLAAIFATTGFERMPPILKRGIQPSDFPQIVAGLIIILSLMSIRWEPQKILQKMSKQTTLTIAIMIAFPIITIIDLFIALAIFAATMTVIWGERRMFVIAIVAVIIPTAVFFLFDIVFDIRFPRGLLTNAWYG